jgi:hypothetical protein
VKDYKYEVAFSFLKEDEPLASRINDLMQDRLSTFIYSKKQEEIAGKDGEETFNRVFGEEALIVVVLYRQNWGKTAWTRIEETSIRNRAYEEGYDFTVFIPLDENPQVPKWLPKTKIWANIDRYGVDGAASVIEFKVHEAGGDVQQETIKERASRLKRQIDSERERKQFLTSIDGVNSANEEFNNLTTQMEILAEEVKTKVGFDIASKHDVTNGTFQWIEIYSLQFCVSAEWLSQYANTLRESRLDITRLKGRPRRPNRMTLHEPRILLHFLFNFDIGPSDIHGWRDTSTSKFLSTKQLADFCMDLLINQMHKQEIGNIA